MNPIESLVVLLAAALVFLAVIALTGCGGTGDDEPTFVEKGPSTVTERTQR